MSYELRRTIPRTRRRGKGAGGIWYVLPAITIVLVVVAYPILYEVYLSLFSRPYIGAQTSFYGLGNYIDTLRNPDFWDALKRMATWTTACVSLQFLLGFAAALLFNERFRGRSLFRALVLIPWILPAVMAAATWRWMYHGDFGIVNAMLMQLGILDARVNWLGDPSLAMWAVIAVNVWKMFPFVMLMLLAGLQAIPFERYEAAWVDGASILQTFRYITLPAMRAVSITTSLLLIIWSLNSFTFIYVMTQGGPLRATEVMSMYIYRIGFQNFRFELAAAGAIILFLIMVVFSALYLWRFYKEDA